MPGPYMGGVIAYERVAMANAPLISPLCGQFPPRGKPLLAASKKFLLDNLAKLVYPKFD